MGLQLRIKFKSEKQSYKVMASSDRYMICVKPFNARNTFLYSIVDLKEQMRGPDNYLWAKHFYDNIYDCKKALTELHSGKLELGRRSIKLDIEKVFFKKVNDDQTIPATL